MPVLYLDAFRTATWLDRSRVNGYAVIFLGLSAAFVVAVLTLSWRDGSDFVAFWGAARLVLSGSPAAAYDMPALFAYLREAGFTHPVPFAYPPPYLALVAPLGLLPYPAALGLFFAFTFAAYALALRWMPRGLYWPALAFPVTVVSIVGGQNGLLTSSLIIGALGLLPRHKALAGLLIAALVIKPQLALLFPVALIAAREWRVFWVAGLGAMALLLASVAWLGVDTLTAMLAAQRDVVALLDGSSLTSHMIQSVFRVCLSLGLGQTVAMAVQALAAIGAASVVYRAWRKTPDALARAAVLCAALPLTTPYVLTYDLGPLIVTIAFLAREGIVRGFRPWERLLLVIAFLAPLPLAALAIDVALAPYLSAALLVAAYWRVCTPQIRATARRTLEFPAGGA